MAELAHRYGANVHILSDPLALALLARLSRKETRQPDVNRLLAGLYRHLAWTAIANELPQATVAIETRMFAKTPQGVWRGQTISPTLGAVVVAIARAGIVPAHEVFDLLHDFLDPDAIRQDHLAVGRAVDGAGKVTGAEVGSVKIGGSVEGRHLLIPDPMGATGSTLIRVLSLYRNEFGRPARTIALNLIVTPEYLRALHDQAPDTIVYAFRVDRGLSAPDVQAAVPGERWAEERGLNDNDYIVPGAGGLGEVITNSWV